MAKKLKEGYYILSEGPIRNRVIRTITKRYVSKVLPRAMWMDTFTKWIRKERPTHGPHIKWDRVHDHLRDGKTPRQAAMQYLDDLAKEELPRTTLKGQGNLPLDEKAPPGAKYERMVKHIKGDGHSKKQIEIAYATAWKNYKKKHPKFHPQNESVLEVRAPAGTHTQYFKTHFKKHGVHVTDITPTTEGKYLISVPDSNSLKAYKVLKTLGHQVGYLPSNEFAMAEAKQNKKKEPKDPLNPHGTLENQENKITGYWRNHKVAARAAVGAGLATVAGAAYLDHVYGFTGEDIVIDYKKIVEDMNAGKVNTKKNNVQEKGAKKKSGDTTVVYKKQKGEDPEYEVPTKDLKKTKGKSSAFNGEPTVDDPETDDRRLDASDGDHAEAETSPEDLPKKQHKHFSAKDDGHDPGDEQEKEPSDKDADDPRTSDDVRNGEDYEELPPEHEIEKDEDGDPIDPNQDSTDGAEEVEKSNVDSGDEPQGRVLSKKAKKVKDIYNKARSKFKGKDDASEEEEEENTGDEDQEDVENGDEEEKDDGKELVDADGEPVESQGDEEITDNEDGDEEQSTEDEPTGEKERVNFKPTMDAITTQANGL
jgi:hypothetical protein